MDCPSTSTGTSREGGESTGVQHVQEESGRVSIRVVLSHQSSPRTHSTYRVSGVHMGIAPSRRPCLARVARALRTYPRATPKQDLDLDSGDYRPVALNTARMVMGIAPALRASVRLGPPRRHSARADLRRDLFAVSLPQLARLAYLAIEAADPSHSTPRACASLPVHARAAACVPLWPERLRPCPARYTGSAPRTTLRLRQGEAGSGSRSMHPRSRDAPRRTSAFHAPNSSTGGSALTSTSYTAPLAGHRLRRPRRPPRERERLPAPLIPLALATPPLRPRLALFVEPARAKQSGMELALDAAEGGERRYAEGGEGGSSASRAGIVGNSSRRAAGPLQKKGAKDLHVFAYPAQGGGSAWCCTKHCWGGGAYGQQLPLRMPGQGQLALQRSGTSTGRGRLLRGGYLRAGCSPDPALCARHSSATSSASSDSDSSRPRLADALQRVSFSPKRPRSPHAPHHPSHHHAQVPPSPLTHPITDSRNIPTPRPNCRSVPPVSLPSHFTKAARGLARDLIEELIGHLLPRTRLRVPQQPQHRRLGHRIHLHLHDARAARRALFLADLQAPQEQVLDVQLPPEGLQAQPTQLEVHPPPLLPRARARMPPLHARHGLVVHGLAQQGRGRREGQDAVRRVGVGAGTGRRALPALAGVAQKRQLRLALAPRARRQRPHRSRVYIALLSLRLCAELIEDVFCLPGQHLPAVKSARSDYTELHSWPPNIVRYT
ncbi:hypothetical protein B0H14DRAFT_3154041 [Mycena olivaceomarginata]|nr:hypothetical protein B0H14DRAFT_3154041 [Mycena olivaceomarginata]